MIRPVCLGKNRQVYLPMRLALFVWKIGEHMRFFIADCQHKTLLVILYHVAIVQIRVDGRILAVLYVAYHVLMLYGY